MIKSFAVLAVGASLLFLVVESYAELWDETITDPQPDDTIAVNDVSQPEGSKQQYTGLIRLPVSIATQEAIDQKTTLGEVDSANHMWTGTQDYTTASGLSTGYWRFWNIAKTFYTAPTVTSPTQNNQIFILNTNTRIPLATNTDTDGTLIMQATFAGGKAGYTHYILDDCSTATGMVEGDTCDEF